MSKLNIYACSGVGAVNKAQRVAQDIKGSGWMRNETLRKYLGKSEDGGCAEYFLYTFIPEEDLAKYNATIYRKRCQQLKTYEYVRELFVTRGYGGEAEMQQIIREGIESTFGVAVEDLLYGIRTGNKESIGLLGIGEIIAIICAIMPLIISVISGIITYCQSVKVARYTAPTMQELEDSAPAPGDITQQTGSRKGLLLAGLAGAALFLFGTFKK